MATVAEQDIASPHQTESDIMRTPSGGNTLHVYVGREEYKKQNGVIMKRDCTVTASPEWLSGCQCSAWKKLKMVL